MRSAPFSSAFRGSLVLALVGATSSSARLDAQEAGKQTARRGAIIVQTTDTAINPLAAELVLPAFAIAVRVSDEGAVLLNVPDGVYLMQARRLGYRPEWRVVRVASDTTQVDFILPPLDMRAGLAVAAIAESRLRDFMRRTRVIPLGSFLTRAEIQRRRPRSLLALLARVSDITVDRPTIGQSVVRSRRTQDAYCPSGMLVLVDAQLPVAASAAPGLREAGTDALPAPGTRRGRWIPAGAVAGRIETARSSMGPRQLGLVTADPTSASPIARADARAPSAIDRIPISKVAGVEVYPTLAGVPPEFRVPGAECGVVLVWTG